MAGILVPSSTGYVNNSTTEYDNDMKSAVVLENVLCRLADKGKIRIAPGLTSEKVEAGIIGFLGEIPEVHQKGCHFYLNIETGKVLAKKHPSKDEILIHANQFD